jgi:hypothetical protein
MHFRYAPQELYVGTPLPGCDTQEELLDSQESQAIQLRERFAALRTEWGANAHRSAMKKNHIVHPEDEPKQGDIILVLHLQQDRKSKMSKKSNYRRQFFKVVSRKGQRLQITSAVGDPQITFKVPINLKKTIKVSTLFDKHLKWKE